MSQTPARLKHVIALLALPVGVVLVALSAFGVYAVRYIHVFKDVGRPIFSYKLQAFWLLIVFMSAVASIYSKQGDRSRLWTTCVYGLSIALWVFAFVLDRWH